MAGKRTPAPCPTANLQERLVFMSHMSVPSLAPTVLLSTLRAPGLEPDVRNRLTPGQDAATPAQVDGARAGEAPRQSRRGGGSPA